MKFNYIKLTSLLLFSFLCFNSCKNDDDSLERNGKPVITVINPSVTVTEGETATFNLKVEYPIAKKIDIRIDVLDDSGNPIPTTEPIGDPNSGNGYAGIDIENITVPYPTWFDSGAFAFGYLGGSGYVATYDPYTEEMQINIDTKIDDNSNPTKTVKLRLSTTSLMTATIQQDIEINIENLVSTDLVTRLKWDGDYINDPCSNLDFDLELYYNGAFTDFSYSDCPEEIVILGTDPDGSYEIDASFWTNGGNTTNPNINVPITIEFIKSGVFVESVDLSSLFPLNDGGLNDGNGSAITTFSINKTGTVYTVIDSNNNQVAQGRMSNNNRLNLEEKRLLKSK